MRRFTTLALLTYSSLASANDWEKFYKSIPPATLIEPSTAAPEIIPSSGTLEQDVNEMWRKGFTLLGYSSFNSGNSKTGDALRLAAKLKARYLVVGTNLTESHTTAIPFTTPSTTTSTTNGAVNVVGSNGYSNGSYTGTTTTSGTQTTYIPITVNRYEKVAVYFAQAAKQGLGILGARLSPADITRFETQRAFMVQAVRDGSPAYLGNILPGDLILTANDQPADYDSWRAILKASQSVKVHLIRNGQPRDLTLQLPEDWRPRD